jgi:hypothetical protein
MYYIFFALSLAPKKMVIGLKNEGLKVIGEV